ncbi:MAG TPA: hypothetical protein VJT81_10690 [Burkholderiales bacterium]|nr:hypothetical protein [Burkholderiales bacterium]
MEEWLYMIAGVVALAIELVAILVVAYGSVLALIAVIRLVARPASNADKRQVWMSYAQWLITGLTFQLAGRHREYHRRANVGSDRKSGGDRRDSHSAYFFSRSRYRGNPLSG